MIGFCDHLFLFYYGCVNIRGRDELRPQGLKDKDCTRSKETVLLARTIQTVCLLLESALSRSVSSKCMSVTVSGQPSAGVYKAQPTQSRQSTSQCSWWSATRAVWALGKVERLGLAMFYHLSVMSRRYCVVSLKLSQLSPA